MDLRAIPHETLGLLAGAASLVALGFALRGAWARASLRRGLRLRQARGAAGERRAEALLAALGYDIVGRQVRARYGLDVDGDAHDVDLRADYLVAREGQRFVAEVKTGRLAPRLDTPATRRQLLEYRVAFDVSGVLLVDAEAGAVRTVTFPLPDASETTRGALAWFASGLALGLAVAALLLRA